MTDRQLIDRRGELFQLFTDGPLNEQTVDSMGAEAVTQRSRWIDEHSHLVDEYSDVLHEIDRRVAARTVLWQLIPPEDLLAEIGSRSESPNPQAWDTAVGVYAKTRLEIGPEVDLLDPSVRQAGQWRDIVLQPIESSAPTLKLTE